MAAADSPNVKFPPPFIYVIAFCVGLWVHRTVGGDALPVGWHTAGEGAGSVIAFGGFALSLSGVATFRRAGTHIAPVRPATALVERGPYRFTRNPMYLGLATFYTGIALLIGRLWPLLFLPVAILVVDRAVIAREEHYLTGRFGDAYQAYCARVHRWLGRRV